jgi:hypothetical protein
MSGKNIKTEVEEVDLSQDRKKILDNIIENLSEYLATPEGSAMLNQMEDIFSRIRTRNLPAPPVLTPREEQALKFIKKGIEARAFTFG